MTVRLCPPLVACLSKCRDSWLWQAQMERYWLGRLTKVHRMTPPAVGKARQHTAR